MPSHVYAVHSKEMGKMTIVRECVVVVMHFVRLRRSDGTKHSLLLFCAKRNKFLIPDSQGQVSGKKLNCRVWFIIEGGYNNEFK